MTPARSVAVPWRRLAFLATFVTVASLLTAWLHPRAPSFVKKDQAIPEITLAAALSRPAGEILWIDARPAARFAASHIPGAISLSEEAWDHSLPAFIDAWDPQRPVVVYCDSSQCHASDSVARRLQRELGVQRIAVLKGGWATWSAQPSP